MTEDEVGKHLLPVGLAEAIEAETGARVAAITPRAGGGASRQGAQVMLQYRSGAEILGYLAYDSRVGDPARGAFFQREAAILEALSGPLADCGVRAPELLAAMPSHLALLTRLVPGSDRMTGRGSAERAAARDLVAQLAALHAIDPTIVSLAGFGDATVPVSQRIAARLAELRAQNLATAPDPVLLLALDWLAAHVPSDRGPPVIVHGDAGPGNFLHEQGRVTALLDWELSHFGDPMEDLAQIWVRMLFQPLLPMREVFDLYETSGGVPVDIERVRYHRLFFQLSFTVSAHADLYGKVGAESANLGVTMMFYTAHMRVIVRSLAELAGVTLDRVVLPLVDSGAADRSYATALSDIRDVIAPRAVDQQAAVKAKALARLIKWWRARDRYGAAFDVAEVAEVSAALAKDFGSAAKARAALAEAIAEGTIGFADALQLCNARMTRDTALMADAMGNFKDSYFPPLD